ncbi:putative membrane protein YMR155W [Cocos nucifera]|uniref:Putative membrane protein YMR155W n=1 Tax=Cocos nucifera TaxID=13894 RepID=A0A8K0IC36_COCNU|nr:putative membrane protein YMR155W [Cocos nucifera]
MFFASFLIMAASGATYIFSIYSTDLKSSLGYDQSTLNTLSFFKDLGANVGILSGLINEVTPPWVVLALGSVMNLFGYLMIYLAITGRVARPAVWQMCLYICIGANSQSFANTGSLVTCVKNFPESRGVVLGLLKGFVGLSGAIFTQLYHAIYGDDSKSLVLLIAWLPAAISIVFVHTIRIMEAASVPYRTSKPFYCFLYISIALATFLMVIIVVEQQVSFSRPESGIAAAIVLLLLFLPLAVVVKEELKIFRQKKQALENPAPLSVSVEEPAITEPPPPEPKQAPATTPSTIPTTTTTTTTTTTITSTKKKSALSRVIDTLKPPARGEDYSILQALFSIDMLVLFLASICGIGGTLTAIDNMGQIGQSLQYPKRSISTFVSLISIWNYAGRVTAGFVSEFIIAKYKFPRPLALTLVLLLSCVGHLLIAFGVSQSLYVASVIIGFCFGAQWPLLFAIISEIFGLKYYSTLYNFGGVASPIGSYILNVRIAGHLYDREADKQNNGLTRTNGKDLTCIGVECFKLSFIIITAATVFGALVSLILVRRTKNFYKGDIYARYREAAAEAENGVAMGTVIVAGKDGEEDKTISSEVVAANGYENKR